MIRRAPARGSRSRVHLAPAVQHALGARRRGRRQGGAHVGGSGGVSGRAPCGHQPLSCARPQCGLAVAGRAHRPPHVVDRQPLERTPACPSAGGATPVGDPWPQPARPGRRWPRRPGVLRALHPGAVGALRRSILGRAPADRPDPGPCRPAGRNWRAAPRSCHAPAATAGVHPAMGGEPARALGGRHAGSGDQTLQREMDVSTGPGRTCASSNRFTRTSARRLEYEFTVHDPESFAAPWTAAFPFTLDPGPVYEAACHEGNYSMPLMLGVGRAQERGGQSK